jgi:hypothetical protein
MLAALFLSYGGSPQAQPAQTPTPFSVYVVAVGSSSYAVPQASNIHGFGSLVGMNTSARLVADRLLRGGARLAVVLTSGQDELVTVADIRAAIARAGDAIRVDRPSAPLLVFYFAGHGISEGVGWNHFSIPGNFTYQPPRSGLDVEALAKTTLYAAALVDDLNKLRVPYMVLLDTCYEAREAQFESPILTGPAIESLRNVAGVVRAFNEFRQSNPVLFSTAPGTTVTPVRDPSGSGPDPVGPLARRALLVFDAAAQENRALDLATFVTRMSTPETDDATRPAVTFAQPGPTWSRTLYRPGTQSGRLEPRRGSAAAAADPCCVRATPPATPTRAMAGRVEFAGRPGEYITGGRTIRSSNASGVITAAVTAAGEVTITADEGGDSWEIAFSMPRRGHVAPGRYTAAEREGFAAEGRPGLAITGSGRGCNKVRGEFAIHDALVAANGALERLKAEFVQYCDDNRAPLRASVDLQAR